MILISEDILDGVNIKYYNGIDLKIAQEHPKDGSGGLSSALLISGYLRLKNTTESLK